MFKKVLVAVASMVMIAVGVLADTATVNGIEWTYTVSNGKASIYNNDYDSAIPETTTGAITIPSSLGGYPVTSIGEHAFYNCSGLTKFIVIVDSNNPSYKSVNGLLLSKDGKNLIAGVNGDVVIPQGVTSIGDDAFYGCRGLTSITIPNSVTSIGDSAFYGCSGLTSVTIPNSVTSIGESAFYWCSGLTSVTIPNSVTSIGAYAFYICSDSLFDTTTIPGVKLVDGWVVGYTDEGPSVLDLTGVRGIGEQAFSYCSRLTSVTIPNSVTSIGDSAFWNCDGLTSVAIPDSVTSIGGYAFYCCFRLTSVKIPNSVTSIGDWAFSGCSNLKSAIFLGDAPRNVGDKVFNYCADDFTIKVKRDTKGWSGDYTSTALPATWHDYPIASSHLIFFII